MSSKPVDAGSDRGRIGKKWGAAAVAIGLLATVIIVYWGLKRPPELAVDDAFITYRYADNLRRGIGLVYNPGEWVLGTTTPLFALLLALLGLAIPSLEILGHWLGVLAWVAASWGALALLWQEGWPRAGLAAGLMMAFQPVLYLSLGMETALVVALMLWVAWAWLGGYKVTAVVLAAGLLLTRQDSALWLLILGLEVWRRNRFPPWREALAVLLLLAPWFLFAWWRYGSPLPNSVTAKIGQIERMAVTGHPPFWLRLWQVGLDPLHSLVAAGFIAVVLLGIWVIVR